MSSKFILILRSNLDDFILESFDLKSDFVKGGDSRALLTATPLKAGIVPLELEWFVVL